jgi:hypothetical protein
VHVPGRAGRWGRGDDDRGLAPPGELHPIQEAFWNKHGLQCGFCTPGMVFAAYELLGSKPRPSSDEIRARPRGQPVSLHGYQNIVRAVQSRRSRWQVADERGDLRLGDPTSRGPRLLSGAAAYTDDFALPGMVHAVLLRSPHAHAASPGSIRRERPRRLA